VVNTKWYLPRPMAFEQNRATGAQVVRSCPGNQRSFCQRRMVRLHLHIRGTSYSVDMLFSQTFDGFQTQLRDTCIHITEHFIEAARALLVYGERWFKNGKLPPELCNKFLVLEHQNPNGARDSHHMDKGGMERNPHNNPKIHHR
jgi:hypothetical protein